MDLLSIPYSRPTLMYFSRSPHKYPGMGVDESIHLDDWTKYAQLDTIRDWRKQLSNFYGRNNLFNLDGYRWYSVEHYYHAMKFVKCDPTYFYIFTLDSGSELSKSDGAFVKHAGRRVKIPQDAIARWDSGGSTAALHNAIEAKYRQNNDLRDMLLLTHNSLLTHRASRFSPLVTETFLMFLREQLRGECN